MASELRLTMPSRHESTRCKSCSISSCGLSLQDRECEMLGLGRSAAPSARVIWRRPLSQTKWTKRSALFLELRWNISALFPNPPITKPGDSGMDERTKFSFNSVSFTSKSKFARYTQQTSIFFIEPGSQRQDSRFKIQFKIQSILFHKSSFKAHKCNLTTRNRVAPQVN